MVKKSEISNVMRVLARRKWAKLSEKEKSEAGRKAVRARWDKAKREK